LLVFWCQILIVLGAARISGFAMRLKVPDIRPPYVLNG
jgi:hypothetical protein